MMWGLQISFVMVFVCTILVLADSQKAGHLDPVQQAEDIPITDLCRQWCTRLYSCPPECMDIYGAKSKRLGGLDGLTFDDYIFMRLLGRDMIHRKAY